MIELNKIYQGDALQVLKTFPENVIDCCITSPPYWKLRDYEMKEQIGQEKDFKDYINNLFDVFMEIKRVLKPKGTLWVNMGDTYNTVSGRLVQLKKGKTAEETKSVTSKIGLRKKEELGGSTNLIKDISQKSLLMIPERFAIKMIDSGWCLRNQIIWYKPNTMPHSAKDRFTVDFEKIFFFVKNPTGYYFDQQFEKAVSYDGRKDTVYKGSKKYKTGSRERWRFKNLQEKGQKTHMMHENRFLGLPEIKEPYRNMRTVWKINTARFKEAHFAVYPEKLVKRMIKAGCPENGIVLDPFLGSGTTAVVAIKHNRNFVGIELNPKYVEIAEKRLEPHILQQKLF